LLSGICKWVVKCDDDDVSLVGEKSKKQKWNISKVIKNMKYIYICARARVWKTSRRQRTRQNKDRRVGKFAEFHIADNDNTNENEVHHY
jgi:hypothetical protein